MPGLRIHVRAHFYYEGGMEHSLFEILIFFRFRARFHYERVMEYSLFVLLIVLLRLALALLSARKNQLQKQRMLHSTLVVETSLKISASAKRSKKKSKIETKNIPIHARCGNKPKS